MIFRCFCSSVNRRADEHLKKSVFREIQKYDSHTKLGLKVFHLQQLSLSSSFRDSDLVLDPVYLSLKLNLLTRDSVSKLSPAQMVATCIALGKLGSSNRKEWSVLADAVKAHVKKSIPSTNPTESTMGQSLSPSQVGLCLYAFCRSGNSWLIKNATVVLIFKHLLRHSVQWTQIDMGWYLLFIRQQHKLSLLSLKEVSTVSLIDQIAYRFNERLTKRSTPRNIVCILHEFSCLGVLPGQAIIRSCLLLEQRKLDPKTMTLLFRALAKLRVYKIGFVHSLADQVVSSLRATNKEVYTARQLSSILHALAKLGIYHRSVVAEIFHKISISQISEIDFTLVCFSLGQFRIRDRDIWARLFERFNRERETLNCQSVAVFLSALSRVEDQAKSGFSLSSFKLVPPTPLQLVAPQWLDQMGKHIRAKRDGFTDRQVLNSLHALRKLGCSTLPALEQWKLNLPLTDIVSTQINFIQNAS